MLRLLPLLPLLGITLGLTIAAWCLVPLVEADLAGVRTMGSPEVTFVLSLPFSFVTWAGLVLIDAVFIGTGNEIPRWVTYLWIAITPLLNWGLIGWLVARWLARRSAASPKDIA